MRFSQITIGILKQENFLPVVYRFVVSMYSSLIYCFVESTFRQALTRRSQNRMISNQLCFQFFHFFCGQMLNRACVQLVNFVCVLTFPAEMINYLNSLNHNYNSTTTTWSNGLKANVFSTEQIENV